MSTIQPYKIHVSDTELDRLQRKLELTRLPVAVPGSDETSWDQGPPISEISRLLNTWRTNFDWRQVETQLNKFPHFTTQVDAQSFGSLDVHFVHKASSQPGAIPLLFLHGWPGCFLEVTKMLDSLVEGGGDAGASFHVVAPSLMDFGFSAASPAGFQLEDHAEVYHNLMQKLDYQQYVIQAGDVGHLISRFIAKKYGPAHCRAYHTNTPLPSEPKEETHTAVYAKLQATRLTESELQGLARAGEFSTKGSGYYKQMSTKPLTISYSLRDSPVGLLSWLYEKLHDWSDNYPWTDKEVLTWVSIYYFSTAGPDASAKVYYAMESRQPSAFAAAAEYIDVPLGILRFSGDLVLLPKIWNQTLGPIAQENDHEGGGHFAAWEKPDGIVNDVRLMFKAGMP